MRLQRYITRRNDFAYYWRSLLFHGLLKSQHMFFFGSDCVVQTNMYFFNKPRYILYKPGHISYEPAYISIYHYCKAAYIFIYDNPNPVYTSQEVTRCNLKK